MEGNTIVLLFKLTHHCERETSIQFGEGGGDETIQS